MRLSHLLGTATGPLTTSAVPSLDRFASACRRVHDRWPDVVAAPQSGRETIVREMLQRIRSNDWDTATLAAVIRAGRVAFEPDYRNRLGFRRLRAFYIRETEVSTSRAFLGALMSVYLATYEPGGRHTKQLAAALGSSQTRLGDRWLELLQNVPDILDPRFAAERIGSIMCDMGDPWSELQHLGFRDPHALGLLHHAHLAYVTRMRPALRTAPGVERMLRWLSPKGREPRAAGAREAIEALLSPWTRAEPAGAIRDRLVEGLLGAYKDPRVQSGGVWRQVREDCLDVVMRWLAGENIQFFLEVVTQVETSHMWQPRREFWWQLYEQGRIDAAWVAFSPAAAYTARRLAKSRQQTGDLAYGTQTARGSRQHTSLLILKIGDRIVVEGSHSYKVHVFRESDPRAPRLYRETYDCEQIRLAPGHSEQAHHIGWQERVRELIDYPS